jgi:WD40 repeat protein
MVIFRSVHTPMRRTVALFLMVAALALVPPRAGWGAGVADHAATQAVVISGHRGAVLAIDHDDSRGLLFTAGADGTVRIWDASTRSLVKSLTVTSLQAGMLAVSPADTKFAVLSMDGLQSFSLEVWDWQKGERLFKIPLTDQPLFLRYSASGRYLLYGLPRWESLRVVNASDGSPVAFHPEGFGMVGFATLSRSGKILMTYRLTGAISYWDLDSGRLLEDLQSVPLLSHIRLTPDLGSVIGSTDSELCLIDVASGRVQARASLFAVTSLDVSPAGDEIACIAESGKLSRWSLNRGAMTRTSAPPSPPPDASVVRYASGALVLGSGSGQLTSVTADGGTSRFPTDERALVTGLAVRGDAVALASSSWIKAFTTGLPDAVRPGAATAESISSLQIENPYKVPTDLTFLDDDSLLVWTTGDGPGIYGILDLRTGGFRSGGSPAQPLATPVIEAVSDGNRCLILAKDGTLRIIDLPSGVTRAQMRRPGARWATLIDGNTVVVGGQPGDTVPGSLVKITIETGETDPIPTTNRYTYEVIYDKRTSTLYSLGVDADETTNLLANTGPDFQVQSVVESTPGEHLFESLCFDEPAGALYTSLGREQISQWKQGSLQKLPASARGAIALYCGDGLLYALNRESSVSLVDTSHGERVAELSVFPEGGFALIMSNGKFAASANSQSHVAVLQDGKLVRDSSPYLVPLRVAEDR